MTVSCADATSYWGTYSSFGIEPADAVTYPFEITHWPTNPIQANGYSEITMSVADY